ncbi:MAG TPA: choice-of-anchor L domain-containing protein, partial [Gammaproteobacteria bacterium]|nr:choice-of-anchor L domain-containing protein [Gammaproteobacteria bacterium]
MARYYRLGTALALLLAGSGTAQAINVSPTDSADTLANSILGSGITLQGSASYTDSATVSQSGTFTDGNASGIGIDQGIVMTTGKASDVGNSNTSDSTSTATGAPGDSDLSALVGSATTNDAATLQFDFTTTTGDLSFNYVFGSEEYNEFVNSKFNDVFGFYLDGTNIARIPGTNTPVSINNVNGGNPLGTNASHADLYNNNDPSDGGPNYNFTYDGFTNVLTAQATGLSSGTHHIKLAIADTGDSDLDSGVFIQGNSFSGEPQPGPSPEPSPVPNPGTLLLVGAACLGLGMSGRSRARFNGA